MGLMDLDKAYDKVNWEALWQLDFVEVSRRRDLKVNANKSEVIVLVEEEGFECDIHVDGVQIFGLCFGLIRYRCCQVS